MEAERILLAQSPGEVLFIQNKAQSSRAAREAIYLHAIYVSGLILSRTFFARFSNSLLLSGFPSHARNVPLRACALAFCCL